MYAYNIYEMLIDLIECTTASVVSKSLSHSPCAFVAYISMRYLHPRGHPGDARRKFK